MRSLFFCLDVTGVSGYTAGMILPFGGIAMQILRQSLSSLPELLTALSVTRPLLVGRMPDTPVLSQTPVFHGYHENPDLSDCTALMDMFRAENCDGLIAIGGGSCMDTAKAGKAMLLTEDPTALYEGAVQIAQDRSLPLIAVPTTAGTGSEATQTAVVYVENRKLSLSHPALLPDAVILDPTVLRTLPPVQKKVCALDALCQGIESFWCQGATAESRRHASVAILSVLEQFPAYLSGNPDAERFMLRAAYESGKAIQITRTTAAHAMSYILTKTYGLPHGYACSITLPALWRRLNHYTPCRQRMEDLQMLLGLKSADDGPLLFEGLLAWLALPARPVLSDADIHALLSCINLQRLQNHPQPLTMDDCFSVYREAFTPDTKDHTADAVQLWREYAGLY